MSKIVFALNALALVSLSLATINLSESRKEAVDGWGQCIDLLHSAKQQLRTAEDRLWEVDCSAPLRKGQAFGGMGIWRATHCGEPKADPTVVFENNVIDPSSHITITKVASDGSRTVFELRADGGRP